MAPLTKQAARYHRDLISRRAAPATRHIFQVGQLVKVLARAGALKPRGDAVPADFEITRLMPEAEASLHYRVKNCTTGQERVVSESEIATAE